MKVGFVHFGGQIGDLVRIDAIRRFFTDFRIPFVEFSLAHDRPKVDIVREVASRSGLRHLARKLCVDRSHPVLKEIQWRIEARQWQDSIERGAVAINESADTCEIFHAETLFAGMVCLRLLERTSKPFVYDMHGVAAEEAKWTGSSEWTAWCTAWERSVVEAAAYVVAVSPLMAQYVTTRYGVPEDRLLLAPNGSYVSDRQARYEEPLTVVYAGNLASYENVMEYAKTAERASSTYDFWMLGDGSSRNELFDYVNSRFVNLVYRGRKTREVALDWCARAQVGFVAQSGAVDLEGDGRRFLSCPIKLFDYMSCGLPVLVAPGEWSSVIRDAECGVVAAGSDAAAFVEALPMIANRDVWTRMSRNGKELVRSSYTWDRVLSPLATIYGKSSERTH